MAMGRPPKPLEQKRKLGNPGQRKLPERSETAALTPLEGGAPPGLERAGEALWRAVTTAASAWLAPSDHPTLMMLCEMADRRASLMAAWAEHGPLIERPGDGHLVANPAGAMLTALEAQMTKTASTLGLTPADRTRMGLAEVKARSKIEEMLARRAERGAQ